MIVRLVSMNKKNSTKHVLPERFSEVKSLRSQ